MAVSRVLLVVAALALTLQSVTADSLAVWSYKPLGVAKSVVDEVRGVLEQVAATKPPVVLLAMSDPTIDASMRTVLKSEVGDRTPDAYLPYVPQHADIVGSLAKVFDSNVVRITTQSDLAALKLDAAEPLTIVFSGSSTLLSATLKKIESTDVTLLYSVQTLGYFDVRHDDTRSASKADGADAAPLPEDPTEEGARKFALTLEGLFETYSLFSPATFMGILALILLLTTTFIGFSCLLNLQTPSHFEKKAE